MKKVIALILAAVCMMSMLSGCGEKKKTVTKDTISVMGYMKCETLDPVSGGNMDKNVIHSIYDSLTGFASDGSIEPRLAESWKESDDGMSITFKLRQDVTFHNGDKFTADDVIYTLDTMKANPYYYFLADIISGYSKVDEYTIKIDKTAPYVKLLNLLADGIVIVPKNYYSQGADAFAKAPVGCGPYKYVSQDESGNITLEAFDGFYGGEQGFKNVIVKAPLEAANAEIALEAGEVDMLTYVLPTEASMIKNNSKLTLVQSEGWSCQTLLLMNEPLKSDSNLRKAIFHGISRDNAIQLANEGQGAAAENMFAKNLMGDYAGCVEDFNGYDEALAKECLSKSSYNGEEITLTICSNPQLAESIQSDLKKIGINIKIEQLDVNGWATKLMAGELQMTYAEMGNDILSVENNMKFFLKANTTYGCNMESNEELEALMAKVPEESDSAARQELVKNAMNIFYDMANLVPIYDCTFFYAYGPDVSYDYPVSAATLVFYLERIKPAK